MKKLLFVAWACILCAPVLLMFSTSVDGGITWLNVMALVYAAIMWKNRHKVVPDTMRRYIRYIANPR